jgi:hypothetical protein
VNPGGAASTGACAIRVQAVIRGEGSRIASYESYIGIYLNDTGACVFNDILVNRTTGTGSSNGYGYYIDGTIAGHLGFASPNASVMMLRCQVGFSASLGTTYGFFIKGAISDVFLDGAETASASEGIHIEGDATLSGDIDVHIVRLIIDSIRSKGIYVTGTGTYGAVSILGGYSSAGASANSCIDIYSMTGVTITGHQFINTSGSTGEVGVYIRSANSISVTNCQFKGITYGTVMTSSYFCTINANTYQRRSAQSPTAYLISVSAGSNNSFLGNTGWSDNGSAVVTTAVTIDGSAASCMVDVTGFRALTFVQKLQINSATVSTVGASGTHYITGSFS